MAKGFTFEEALQPTVKGFSFEEALQPKPEPILSPEEQVMSQVGTTTGTTAADLAKLTAAGAVKGTLGAPEAVQSGLGAAARETAFGPTEALNLIADPRALTNKLAGAIGISPIFEEKKLVPEEVTTKQKAAVDEILTKGKIPQLKTLTEFGNKLSEDIESSISPEMKLALAESQPTGNILKALETGDFSEVSLGKNPTFLGLSGQAAKVFGSAAPAFLTAALTKSAGPAAAVGFGQAGAEGVDEARNYIGKMSDNELTQKSEYFRNLVALGYTPKDAREMTIVKAGDTAALYQGTVGALGGAFTNKLLQGAFDKTLLASAKSRLAKIAQGTALGATEGGLSEMAEGVATDLGIDKSVVREIGVDSFANLVLGALGEGAPGTVRGAIARTEAETPPAVKAAPPAPAAPAEVVQPAPVTPPVTAQAVPGAIQEEDVEPESVTGVTPPTKPTFDEWRTQQGLTFRSKEDYQAALPQLQAQYQAEMSGAPTVQAPIAAPVEAPQQAAPLTKEQKTMEKTLRGIKADEVPLHEFQLGIIAGMEGKAPNAEIISSDAINLLKANDLVKENPDGTLTLLPKGNSLLNDIREFTKPMGKAKTPDEQKALFSKFIPQIETGEVVAAPKAAEVVQEPAQVEEELPKFSKAKDVPVIPKGQAVSSTDPDVLKKFNEIMDTYEPESGISQEDSFLEAINNDVKSKLEKIEAPSFKKGFPSNASLEVAPFNGGWVGGSRIMSNTGGYASGASIFDKVYPTKQEAINAEIDKLRRSAESYGNTKAISWLDSIDPRKTKEGKIETNKARQAEKKAKAVKPKEEIGVPLVKQRLEKNIPINVVSSKDGKDWYATGQRVRDTDYLVKLDLTPDELKKAQKIEKDILEYGNIPGVTVQEKEDLKNKLAALLTPAAKRAVGFVEEKKPKIEEIVSPQVAASMKDIEFQNKLIKANKENTITKNQFSRLFKLYQDGKTPQADEQLTKMLAQNEKKAKAKEEPEVKEAPKAKPSSEEEQLIQDAVMYAAAANRTGMDESAIRDKVENARIKDPATVLTLLKNSVENLKKQAKDYVIREASDDYNDQIGQRPGKDSQIVDAVKGGALNIEGKPYAEAFYKIFNVKSEKIKKAAGETPLEKQLVKFESNVFSTADTNPEIYKKAAIKFLESPLTSPVPKVSQFKLDVSGLENIKPLPIEKKSYPKATGFEGQIKVLDSIAAPEGEIRYYLKGIHLDDAKKRMVATDGHRMAIINNADFKGMPPFKGTGDKVIGRDGKYMEGKFPEVDRVISGNKVTGKPIVVNTTELGDYARGVKKAWRYASGDKYSAMRIAIGDEIQGFNSEYIEDMANLFKSMGYDTFNVQLSKNQAMVATSPDGKVMQIVMGMRDASPVFEPFKMTKGKAKTEPMKTQPSIELEKKKTVKQRTQEIHDEKINEYSRLRQRKAYLTRKVAEGKVSLGLQRELSDLLELEKELKQDVKLTTPKNISPENFMERALKEYNKKNISRDVLDVVEYFYNNSPEILNGIKLSVRQTEDTGVMGNFAPLQRIVTLYKGAGAESPGTARHEIMHSLEQMMNSHTREAVIESWRGALEMAIKQHADDARSSKYFNAVLDFINVPNETNFKRAVSIMPSKDFYQFINPSEYWAVNAEKLMAAKMGTPWAKFVKFVKGLAERLKAVFGLENDHAIHKAFNDLIKGEKKRLDKESLTSYLNAGATDFQFLYDVKDVDDLLEKHERPNTPLHPSGEVKDAIMGGYQKSKKIAAKMAENPLMTGINMVGKADRAITYARNKNVWFGSGLDQADFARYNGQLRNSQGLAAASVAVTNAIHGGHVGTQVMIQGGFEFDYDPDTGKGTQMFRAVKRKYSMANVVRLKHDLEEKLGNQRAANVVNAYFEAKRSRSIINEYLNREAAYEEALESGEDASEAAKNLKNIEVAMQKVSMTDEAIDDFIALDKEYEELRKMMDNWTAVNHNMLDMMEFSGVISKKRAANLRAIEDYVPWYRIMDDQTDIHTPMGVRGMTNVGQEKKFREGEVDRDIDDIVDNMIHNVMMMTRNSMKNYAANRVAMEYATRKENGKIQLYPTEGSDAKGVRTNIIINGRRVIVNFPDPLVAEAVLGMENIEIPMIDILAFFANGLRRGITTFPVFQVSQLFMDAPTAAWVSGVKNPAAVWASTFGGFIRALKPSDPIVDMLKAYGIGGYQSSARTPEKELKLEIGLLDKSVWARTMKTLDHIGDASDYAQRRAVYKQVLKETGDEMQALIQANNVIDFLKRGSGKGAQFVTRTVSFMNAYAQSIDVLATALAGGGLKGKSRTAARNQMIKTGMLLAGTTLLYCMAVGADDEYDKLDDQTKIRNIIIPGTKIRLPMHTSASFLFKSIPELIYNKIMKDGTKNQMDNTRLRKALGEAAIDSLLGPNMIPTGVKPVAEIALNHNFFTGGTVTPKGMEKLEAFRQYNSSTSELGKVMSALTRGALNPIEMDHLMRGLFGTAGAAVMYGSNLFSGDRVAPQAKDNPLYGSFILPEVPRGREDLFYDLKERSDKKYETFVDLMKKQRTKEGQQYREENKALINAHGFVTQADADLKRINAEIRRLSDLPEEKMSSAEKRARITKFQETKNNILEQTIKFRLKAEL